MTLVRPSGLRVVDVVARASRLRPGSRATPQLRAPCSVLSRAVVLPAPCTAPTSLGRSRRAAQRSSMPSCAKFGGVGDQMDQPANAQSDLLSLPLTGEMERLVRARGAMFLVTTRQGDLSPAGARELGLFYQDTRFLSYYELEVKNCRAARLSAETSHPAYNQIDLMVSDPEREELLEDPSNFLHIRRRQI